MTRKGPLAIDYEALWQEGMKDWHGQMPERMVDDQLEEQFWAQSIKRKKTGQTDPYAAKIFQEIKKEYSTRGLCIGNWSRLGQLYFSTSRKCETANMCR